MSYQYGRLLYLRKNERIGQKFVSSILQEAVLDVSFKQRKLQKTCEDMQKMVRTYGEPCAKKLGQRLGELRAAHDLGDISHFPPARCHELTGNRRGQFAVDAQHPYRLILVPDHDPIPKKDDGGIDLDQVTRIKILEIEDYH